MTLSTILLLMAVAAIVAGLGAATLRFSAWRVFGVALVPTAIVLVLAERETSRACDSSPASGTAGGLFETAAIMSVTFFAAAAVAGIADGVRLASEKEYGPALTRFVGVTLMSAIGVGIVFFSVLSAALHCD